jgi:hypothetical protein
LFAKTKKYDKLKVIAIDLPKPCHPRVNELRLQPEPKLATFSLEVAESSRPHRLRFLINKGWTLQRPALYFEMKYGKI